MGSTYDKTVDTLDITKFEVSTDGYTLPPGIYEIIDLHLMLESIHPNEAKVSIANHDMKLRSNLSTNKTKNITKKPFFCTILGFTKFHSGPLRDNEGSQDLFKRYQDHIKMKTPILLLELIKSIRKVIALMVVLLMVSENRFCSLLH